MHNNKDMICWRQREERCWTAEMSLRNCVHCYTALVSVQFYIDSWCLGAISRRIILLTVCEVHDIHTAIGRRVASCSVLAYRRVLAIATLVSPVSGGSSPGPGGHAPHPVVSLAFFANINTITKPTAYDWPRQY